MVYQRCDDVVHQRQLLPGILAFTLVELSLVLVIISLVIGGVVVGREMIKNSQVNAQVAQLQKFDMAVNTFKMKYNSLPADSITTGYYTYTGGCCLVQVYGNGNGYYDGHPTLGNFMGNEVLQLFVALGAHGAGVLPEEYTPCNSFFNCGSGNWTNLVGKLWPELKIAPGAGMIAIGGNSGGLYYLLGITIQDGATTYSAYYHNAMSKGIIHPVYAYAMDRKMDDSNARGGKVFASTGRATINSSCGSFCSAYTDTTVMQLAPSDGTCLKADGSYNGDAQGTTANLCRLVVKSAMITGN